MWAATNMQTASSFIFPYLTCRSIKVLGQCLQHVVDWQSVNRLKLNPDKMEIMLGWECRMFGW